MAKIICLDFDDTVVMDNTARQIFEQFATPEWKEFQRAYHEGKCSVEQFNAKALDLVEAPAAEIQEYVRAVARPRPGFPELYDWAQWNGWLVTIVSNGFDLYIDPVLETLGLDRIARHSGRTRRAYRWRVTYYSPRGIELQEGFKLAYAHAFRQAGDFVVYVGDGTSDIPAARLAPVTFARSTLLDELQSSHPQVYAFETFGDVTDVLEHEAATWGRLAAEGSI